MVLHGLGMVTVAVDMLMIVLLILFGVKLFSRPEFDIQAHLIFLSAIFLLPVMLFESLLFVDLRYNLGIINLGDLTAKILFFFGVIGYFIYILHLLTIDDFPSLPLIFVAIMSGFALGSMLTSVQLDISDPERPITYQPLVGGIFFLLTMNLFTVASLIGFLHLISQFRDDNIGVSSRLSKVELIAITSVALTPPIMFLIRILELPFAFNVIFLPTTIGFCLHFLCYLYNSSMSGYPAKANLIGLIILDTESQTVLSGYSIKDEPDRNKLDGMAILAVDNMMRQIMDKDLIQLPEKVGNYGDILFLRKKHFVLIASFRNGGQNLGRIVLNTLLGTYVDHYLASKSLDFKKLVKRYLYVFTHKKIIDHQHFYHLEE